MSTPSKKLFLLDAFALIYRAHFAFSKNPRINSKGFNTGCVLGFTNTLLDILNNEKPSHIAICFDTSAPTFRHVEYEEYKAQREKQPEDITLSIPIIRDLIKAFNIPILEKDGFEADDVVGTVAKQAGKQDFEVFMMTPDKDYCQLVSSNVYLYKPNYLGKGVEIWDETKVLAKWEIEKVEQVADILGLWGDASDNIPGIPGIGEKTAKKLIAKYGSVEELVANADDLKGKQKENVVNFGEQGILSKHLATIKTDVPVEWTEEELVVKEMDEEKVKAIFEEMEFKTLSRKLFNTPSETTSTTSSPKKRTKKATSPANQMDLFGQPVGLEKVETAESDKENIYNTLHDYHLVNTPELRKGLITLLEQQTEYCFDTETDSLDANLANLVGFSFSYYEGEAYYVPVPQSFEEAKEIVQEFKHIFEHQNILKIGQNIKYDMVVLKKYNVHVTLPLFDTMIAHYLIEPDMRHNMDFLAETYLNYVPVSIESLLGKKGKKQKKMSDLQAEQIVDYACEDADITLRLKNFFAPILDKNNLTSLFYDVEIPLIHVLATMEGHGVSLDVEALADISEELSQEVKVLEKKIYEEAGEEFNIASPRQLGDILFGKLALDPKAKKTKTGQYATGEEVLAKLKGEHEIVRNILSFRELQKLKSTYVDALPKMISPLDNKVHTTYNQAVAATGRLSSANPNLQNIPIRTAKGREVRKAFVKQSDDYTLFSADYSQIELRIMAAFSKDESMIDAFKNGKDIHSMTASKIYKVNLEDVTEDQRRKAKTANFGIIYGISAFGLSQRLNIPRKEASELIKAYFTEFPAVKEYMDTIIQRTSEVGYVETVLNRKRYVRDINSQNATVRGYAERNAINAPIQGSAADIIKVAMIRIHGWMQKEQLKSKMLLQVHDELIFDVHNDELELVQTKVPELMKAAIELEVPMEVGAGLGNNWLEAH
ncbi:MAG: DNA polymerase I [Cytophagales bacterium]|nr:DNA polymerase I [Cytophagales bacterium]